MIFYVNVLFHLIEKHAMKQMLTLLDLGGQCPLPLDSDIFYVKLPGNPSA